MNAPGVDPKDLTRLVSFDRRIHGIQDAMAASSRRLKSLQELEAEYAADLAEARKKQTDAKLQQRMLEAEVEDLKRQVKTHNHRLNEIQDTREYRALNEEIRYLQRQIGDKEEAQLAIMESLEGIQAQVDERTEALKAKQAEIGEERARIDGDRGSQEGELGEIRKAREAFMETLPAGLIRFYERRANRLDLPVVWLDDDACGYCHHKLTPQGSLEVRYAKSLVECESCGRVVVAALDPEGTGDSSATDAESAELREAQ